MEGLGEVRDIAEELGYTDEDLESRLILLNKAKEEFKSYGLKWTYRSINYLVNREEITFNQLRSCIFLSKKGEARADVERAVYLLCTCGLIGVGRIEDKDYQQAEDKAYNLMEKWRESIGSISILHCLIVDTLENKHFFIDSQDALALDALALNNLQKSLALSHLAIAEQTRMQQQMSLTS